jgi:hypothetical protein
MAVNMKIMGSFCDVTLCNLVMSMLTNTLQAPAIFRPMSTYQTTRHLIPQVRNIINNFNHNFKDIRFNILRSYRVDNSSLSYKHQSVNVVWGNNCCLL